MRQRFTVAGAMQFAVDVDAIKSVIDAGLAAATTIKNGDAPDDERVFGNVSGSGIGTGVRGMEKVFAALRLLVLPTEDEGERDVSDDIQAKQNDKSEDVSHGHDEPGVEVDEDKDMTGLATTTATLTLWHAERMLFASNEHAHAFLASLGADVVEALTESEARSVVARRVELEG